MTAPPRNMSLFALSLLGCAQICAWGSVYYTFSLTGPLIARDLGLSSAMTTAGFTFALIVGAFAAAPVGHALDRFGGRPMLALGSAFGALAMAAFVAGTVPAVMGVALLGRFFGRRAGPGMRVGGAALFVLNGVMLAAMAVRVVA